MEKKLKIRIGDIDEAEHKLIAKGAKITGELDNEFVYFHQPPNKVLKIVSNKNGHFLMMSEKQGERFEVIENYKIDDPTEVERKLANENGITKRVHNRQKIYKYRSFIVTLNQVKGVGNFLTLIGQNPTLKVLAELGFTNPQIAAEAFDSL